MLPLVPANYPELSHAAARFHEMVREAKAAGLDRADLRRAIRRAEAAYLSVFGEIARRPKKPAADDDSSKGANHEAR
jgi:hypothetical protein